MRWARRNTAHWGDRFFQNYFGLIGNDLAFVVIPKNAVTFLKRVAILAHEGEWVAGFRETHDRFGYTAQSPYLVPEAQMASFEREHGPRRKFAVWRDPIARLESAYTLFCRTGSPHVYLDYLDVTGNPDLDRYAAFLRWEWGKPSPALMDEHFRRQSDFYQRGAVDDIIRLADVAAYLGARGIAFRAERSNASEHRFTLTDEALLADARRFYAADEALRPPAWRG